MKTESEKQKLKIFLTTLGVMALVINCLFLFSVKAPVQPYAPRITFTTPAPTVPMAVSSDEQIKKEQEAAARKAAEEHAQFIARYVDTAFTKKAGFQTVAVSVSAGQGKTDRAVENALIRRFQNSTTEILPSFFKPAFIADGLFDRAFNGSDDVSTKLELSKSLNEMLLARETVEYSTNGPDLQNVITATARLDISIVPVTGASPGQTWTFTAAGAGFSQMQAQAMAQERLVKQIIEDKKMLL